MKKKVRKLRRGARKASVAKKSYYKPKKKASKKVAKKKSYYKPKKKTVDIKTLGENPLEVGRALIDPAGVKEVANNLATFTATVDQKPKRPAKYLNNKDLLAEVIKSKKQAKMTNELAKMLQLLTLRYGKKGNFANYTYNDDMQSYAMLMICKTWQGFDPAKSSNPFAWFTQCIKNSFIQYLNYEKRQRDIRDEVLVDNGLSPSYNYQYEYSGEEKGPEAAETVNVEHQTDSSHNDENYNVTDDEESPSSDMLQY